MIGIFNNIYHHYIDGSSANLTVEMVAHIENNLVYNDDHEDHLPIPVFSYIRPTMGTQFILHLLLSLGHFSTEIDLLLHPNVKESLRYAKLIGENDDEEALQQYSSDVLKTFITEQLIYFPNTRQLIDSWIVCAGDLLDEVIINNNIPITSMPSVQQSSLYASIEEDKVAYIKEIKNKMISSALMEMGDARIRCSIPSKDNLLNATKENPANWDAISTFEKSPNQSNSSFNEQKLVVETVVSALNNYSNIFHTNFVKSCTIIGSAGWGKSFTMQYLILYAISLGLVSVSTSVMARRSCFLGGKHIHRLFLIPTGEKGQSPHRLAELAICKLLRSPEKLNLLRALDVIFLDEIGQLSAEMLSVLDIILRKTRDSNIFMGGILIISTMDHTQLQPVEGRPFLLSSHVITCFKMIKLQSSVRASDDIELQRIIQIASMHYSAYVDDPELLVEFRTLVSNTCVFVENWDSPEITPFYVQAIWKEITG